MLFMHGNGNSRLFEPSFEDTEHDSWRAGAHVFAFDRPGVGHSDPHKHGDYTSSAKDTGCFAEALGLSKFAVLGYSSGGVHALAAASLLPPGSVTAAGLISSDGPYAMMKRDAPLLMNATPNEALSWQEAVEQAEKLQAAHLEAYATWIRKDVRRDACIADSHEAARQGFDCMARDLFLERQEWPFALAPLSMPCLIWHGALDDEVHPDAATFLADKIGARLDLVDGETHSMIRRRWRSCLNELVDASHAS